MMAYMKSVFSISAYSQDRGFRIYDVRQIQIVIIYK